MTQVIGTVTAAGPIQKPKRDGTFFTLNEVTIDGQVYVARKDVCNLATGFIGQRVSAITRVEVKGDYTNFYLDFIEPAGGGSQPGQAEYVQQAQAAQQQQTQPQFNPQPVQQVQQAPPQPVQAITPAQQVQGAQAAQDAKEAAKTLSIHRQCASKVAAVLVREGESVWDFWSNCAALVAFYESGVYPAAVGDSQPTQVFRQQAPRQQGEYAPANVAAYQPFPRDQAAGDFGDPGPEPGSRGMLPDTAPLPF